MKASTFRYVSLCICGLMHLISFGQIPAPSQYNSAAYPDVLTAAQMVGFPFLMTQGIIPPANGYTVDTAAATITYNNTTYKVIEQYTNPGKTANNSTISIPTPYFILPNQFATLGISANDTFTWPSGMPNVACYNSSKTFCSFVDCVGYGSRLLSVTDTAYQKNAYVNLRTLIRTINQSPFAASGHEASAYEYAVAFPVLGNTLQNGWSYVAGAVETYKIDSFNHTKSNKIGTYTAQSKGGFSNARPGDILSFGYDNGGDNGHFMVFREAPQLLQQTTQLQAYYPNIPASNLTLLLDTVNVYAVPLYDCSGQKAHFNDSRAKTSGIGQGTILMFTSKTQDIPMGFVFSSPNKSGTLGYEPMGNHVVAITVGRYTPITKRK